VSEMRPEPGAEYSEAIIVSSPLEEMEARQAMRKVRIARFRLLWERRKSLMCFAVGGFVLGILAALLIPVEYVSTARLMPPDQGSSASMAIMSAIAGKVGDGLAGGLGGLLPGMKTTGELFVGVLGSRTIQDDLIEKFDLRKVYGAPRWEDARKVLAGRSNMEVDRKSGIVTIQVTDHEAHRAAAMTGEYITALNRLVVTLNTSSAHRERVFLEERLRQVKENLEVAEKNFSEFASKNSTLDLKEQGKAMVEAGAMLEGQLIAAQTELQGLRQVYTDSNVRVRATQARIEELRRQLRKIGGKAESASDATSTDNGDMLYPSIRKLPLLGVTFADLYREARVQEAVFETLTKQYELAKVEEAKEIPSIKVLDPPYVPDKKSFPPRTIVTLLGTLGGILFGTAWILGKAAWMKWDTQDPGRLLMLEMGNTVQAQLTRFSTNGGSGARIWRRLLRRGAPEEETTRGTGGEESQIAATKCKNPQREERQMGWDNRKVLVTGGASFIGATLVDALIARGATVRVVDNLSSGKLVNLQDHIASRRVELLEGDLLDPETCRTAVEGCSYVFHLAADHGGRGYVDLHQTACSTNMILDGLLFRSCHQAGVEKVIFASSGCVYPNHLQTDPNQILYLTEDQAGPPYDADNLYGWAKLMAEKTLQAYYREFGMKSASCRYFTVYGERGHENHAVIAMIARAFIKQDPFIVWGNGEQVRNWTYVGDIVEGTIRAAEVIEDGTAVNLGTMERVRVIDAVSEVLRYTGHKAKIELHPELPTGPLNRVADNSLARKLLGWEPNVKFVDGLHRTIDWYFRTKNRAEVAALLDQVLTERTLKPLAAQVASAD
jgi:nucleoside-diphosphate-sugar epimerase/capsule polysaccharide export protein KpsE/RkpR